MSLSVNGTTTSGTFLGTSVQSRVTQSITGTWAMGTSGSFPIEIGTNDIVRLTILAGGTLDISSTTAPGSNPGSGHAYLYLDAADNKVKILDSTGAVNVLN